MSFIKSDFADSKNTLCTDGPRPSYLPRMYPFGSQYFLLKIIVNNLYNRLIINVCVDIYKHQKSTFGWAMSSMLLRSRAMRLPKPTFWSL